MSKDLTKVRKKPCSLLGGDHQAETGSAEILDGSLLGVLDEQEETSLARA